MHVPRICHPEIPCRQSSAEDRASLQGAARTDATQTDKTKVSLKDKAMKAVAGKTQTSLQNEAMKAATGDRTTVPCRQTDSIQYTGNRLRHRQAQKTLSLHQHRDLRRPPAAANPPATDSFQCPTRIYRHDTVAESSDLPSGQKHSTAQTDASTCRNYS